ncbi:hypothetical protein KP78_22830 [Jeotgalibacillus soli]|uniref:Uncharacterized protein n=1 Tax=Jeotgalibacillus soli TaxID=889306 RepID=A0A0C2RSK6_9BACL|nr:hypothetical protein KP78_22830 [Jeotgalibacillus soli]
MTFSAPLRGDVAKGYNTGFQQYRLSVNVGFLSFYLIMDLTINTDKYSSV